MLTHLSLFSGIGGIDLAAEWAGFTTVGQCEWADYPTKVLEKHWPNVPRWRDIRTLTGESFYERTGLRTVDLISGGFPCQPFSVAGKRKGKDDDRYLWPELRRVLEVIRPLWFLGENVPNILNMGVEICLSDLETIGFEGGVFVIPALSVGTKFIGERVFIIATTAGERWDCLDESFRIKPSQEYIKMFNAWMSRQNNLSLDMDWPIPYTGGGIKRNDYGISEGVDRLKCLGNAVVPQQVYPILAAISEIERGMTHEIHNTGTAEG